MLKSNGSRIEPWGTLAKTPFHWLKELFIVLVSVRSITAEKLIQLKPVIKINNDEHIKKKPMSCAGISTILNKLSKTILFLPSKTTGFYNSLKSKQMKHLESKCWKIKVVPQNIAVKSRILFHQIRNTLWWCSYRLGLFFMWLTAESDNLVKLYVWSIPYTYPFHYQRLNTFLFSFIVGIKLKKE